MTIAVRHLSYSVKPIHLKKSLILEIIQLTDFMNESLNISLTSLSQKTESIKNQESESLRVTESFILIIHLKLLIHSGTKQVIDFINKSLNHLLFTLTEKTSNV